MKCKSITAKNFLSVGDNPITIELNRSNLTVVTGANGSGKTTVILEAVFFVLFGVSYRSVKKAEMINSINRSGALVTLAFDDHSGNEYIVTRGIKPDVFTINKNGKDLPDEPSAKLQQAKLESIVGLTKEQAIQSVFLGSADYRPFLTLSLPERRVFVEKALGLGVYAVAQKAAKVRLSVAKLAVVEANTDIEKLKVQLATVEESIKASSKQYDELITPKEKELNEKKEEYDVAVSDVAVFSESLPNYTDAINQLNGKLSIVEENQRNARAAKAKFEYMIKQGTEFLEMLNHSTDCPTCKQKIDPTYIESVRTDTTTKLEEPRREVARLSEELTQLSEQHSKISEKISKARQKINDNDALLSQKTGKVNQLMLNIKQLERDIASLNAAKLEASKSVGAVSPEDLRAKIVGKFAELNALKDEYDLIQTSVNILGEDGIRKEYVKNVLPLLNDNIQNNMLALGATYSIQLTDEFDTVVVGRFAGEFSYESLSMGERSRCDLAVLLAWLSVSETSAGVKTNLLVLDEVGDNSLDYNGQDGLIELLRNSGKNVFFISHRDINDERITGRLNFAKKGGFTTLM